MEWQINAESLVETNMSIILIQEFLIQKVQQKLNKNLNQINKSNFLIKINQNKIVQ